MSIGSISIGNKTVEFIKKVLPEGKTILELGSGNGTITLSDWYNMISVENQPEWQDQFPLCTTYINVGNKMYDNQYQAPADIPNQKGWYNPDDLIPQLPHKNDYHLILIDGPGGWLGRAGFLKHLDYFNTNIPIILDDCHREAERIILDKLAKKLNTKSYFDDVLCIGYLNC